MSLTAKEKFIITNRRRDVAKLYKQHKDQAEIAEKLGVSQPTVSRDIDFITKQWKGEALEEISIIRARELAELDEMEKEAAANYENARPAIDDGRPTREMDRWFKRRLEVKERKAKFLGLDQPAQLHVENSGQTEGQVIFYLPDNGRDPDFIQTPISENQISKIK